MSEEKKQHPELTGTQSENAKPQEVDGGTESVRLPPLASFRQGKKTGLKKPSEPDPAITPQQRLLLLDTCGGADCRQATLRR